MGQREIEDVVDEEEMPNPVTRAQIGDLVDHTLGTARPDLASLDQRIAAEHALEATAALGLDVDTAAALVVTLYVEETAVGLTRQIELLDACGGGNQHSSVHALAPE